MAGLNAKQAPKAGAGKKFKPQDPVDPGTYPARICQIIDLGLQPQRPWQGQPKPPAHEIMLSYELTDEFMKDEDGEDIEDKPRWISETMPLRHIDSELAKSTKRYKALDPNMEFDGDFSQLLGAPGNVLITTYVSKKDGFERNGVDNLTAMRPRDAAKTPELQNPPKIFTLEDPDMEVFGSLPEWLQEKIKSNLEYPGSVLEGELEGGKGKAPSKPTEAPEEQEEESEGDVQEQMEDAPW